MNCTVIIPVGPGHAGIAELAFRSVIEAAEDRGAFDTIYAIVGDDSQGELGRSAARNKMVQGPFEEWMAVVTHSPSDDMSPALESEWLFFLDADDVMCAPGIWGESAFKVVTPYLQDYDAVWGPIYELHQNGNVIKRKQTERLTTYSAYVRTPPALSCQMGHFVRRSAFPGFDESLDVCEDVDLYLKEWKNLRCIKQEKPLFLNRRGAHSWMSRTPSKRKRYTGRDWSERAEEMLKAARAEL